MHRGEPEELEPSVRQKDETQGRTKGDRKGNIVVRGRDVPIIKDFGLGEHVGTHWINYAALRSRRE